ncbi:MAG TPA: hypothetical protein VKQ30_22115 [Ktedonobacterales bacterium]|nr:hypothetical protein [Ktedonobacterales bacterium]
MGGWRAGSVRITARLLTAMGLALLLVGAAIGWILPRVPDSVPIARQAYILVARAGIDTSGYLGADITALAVIIAVVIGFNATTLQIAGQTHSLALVRVILLSLTPFLLCWSVTTGVALIYFLLPPIYVAQLWQMLLWFAAVVTLMVAYLWDLPWRISGQYVGLWAIRKLRGKPIAQWESLDSYSALQSAVSLAAARGDLGTVRAITLVLGHFLAGVLDPRAESRPEYDRDRYRALKNLLSGCAQNAGQAPNAVAYNLGYVQAGVLLQAIAVGHTLDDPHHDLFSGMFRAVKGTPERLNPLWTGTRHALCRASHSSKSYLLQYWLEHKRWPGDDPRRVVAVAEGLAWIHAGCWRELRAALPLEDANAEAAQMLLDLYRYLVIHLGRQGISERAGAGPVRLADLPLSMLDTVHAAVLRVWPNGDADQVRVTVVNAYESYRKQLTQAIGSRR